MQRKSPRTPKLKAVRKMGSTPHARRSSSKNKTVNKGINNKRKRSSIGISSLSKSKISTPKPTKKAKSGNSTPLMPKVLLSKSKVENSNPPTIVLDDTDDGIIADKSTKPTLPTSPEVEILTVKITPNGTKKVKGPSKSKSNNPQKIFSKFNFPNPVFPKDGNYIPLNNEEKSQRKMKNPTGYKFDPSAKANINFTPLVDQMTDKVYNFEGTAGCIIYNGKKRYVLF